VSRSLLLPEAIVKLTLVAQRPNIDKGLTREIGRHRGIRTGNRSGSFQLDRIVCLPLQPHTASLSVGHDGKKSGCWRGNESQMNATVLEGVSGLYHVDLKLRPSSLDRAIGIREKQHLAGRPVAYLQGQGYVLEEDLFTFDLIGALASQ